MSIVALPRAATARDSVPARSDAVVPALGWLRSYEPTLASRRPRRRASRSRRTCCPPASATRRSRNLPPEAGTLRVPLLRARSSGCSAVRATRRSPSRRRSRCWSARRSASWPAATRRASARWRRARRCWSRRSRSSPGCSRPASIVNFVSETVLIGFKAGVALYLASTQLPKLFGIHGSHGDFWERIGTSSRTSARPTRRRWRSASARWRCSCSGKSFCPTARSRCSSSSAESPRRRFPISARTA